MSCCRHWHHGPWCGQSWWYEETPFSPPVTRRRRRREDMEDYLSYLEDELKRVREELEETKTAR